MTEPARFYGIYRGTVVNNIDPMMLGRIMATVPDVGGTTPSTWAMPCVPLAGEQMGTFMVPQIGSGVWIQFEAGDPDKPVWMGGWWGNPAEVPALALAGTPGVQEGD
jgi:Type VI secretion system/phage-baseplate injector OB domain